MDLATLRWTDWSLLLVVTTESLVLDADVGLCR